MGRLGVGLSPLGEWTLLATALIAALTNVTVALLPGVRAVTRDEIAVVATSGGGSARLDPTATDPPV